MIHSLDFSILSRYYPKLFLDYLRQDVKLKSFFKWLPGLQGIDEIIYSREKVQVDRRLLVEVFKDQYRGTPMSELCSRNLDFLSSPGTFTVTAAHQPCFLSGPLFVPYKIMTAIRISEFLNEKYSTRRFVPVFWMHSEDHDINEINHVWLSPENKLTIKLSHANTCGNARLLNMNSTKHEIRNKVSFTESDAYIDYLFGEIFVSGETLKSATRKFLNFLFGKYGLLILDGDHSELKSAFRTEMKTELLNNTCYQTISETTGQLHLTGYTPPVSPGKINLFYITEEGRFRIARQENGYKLIHAGNTFSEETIIKLLSSQPECFSPNVCMRPLYQEKILPDVAFIGGPSEISYWLQLKTTFESFDIPIPLLLPRFCGLFMTEEDYSLFTKYDITPEIFLNEPDRLHKIIAKKNFISFHADQYKKEIDKAYEHLSGTVSQIDKSLLPKIEAQKVALTKKTDKLEEQLIKRVRKDHPNEFRNIFRIRDYAFPQGNMQERRTNFLSFGIPPERFLDLVYSNVLSGWSVFNVFRK